MSGATAFKARLTIVGVLSGLAALGASTGVAAARAGHEARFVIPADALQLIVVSSPTSDPRAPGYLATLQTYERAKGSRRWRRVLGPWQAEAGRGHLLDASLRREGDGTTPTGVFGIGTTIYGNRPDPGGLHYGYHRLKCGDWWDEDPYSVLYNRFVQVPCTVRPAFAPWSEALWTETVAYPYFAVIRFDMDPVRRGSMAPGSGIFLHSWVGGATAGCVAVRERALLRILRWITPSAHPVIEIGTDDEVSPGPRG